MRAKEEEGELGPLMRLWIWDLVNDSFVIRDRGWKKSDPG
jgi:hypothetical protein